MTADIKVTCAHCGATYDRDDHRNLTHPEPECATALIARYDSDEAFRARITEMYLNDRFRFIAALISLAYSLGASRPEAVEFANAVTGRIKSANRRPA